MLLLLTRVQYNACGVLFRILYAKKKSHPKVCRNMTLNNLRYIAAYGLSSSSLNEVLMPLE